MSTEASVDTVISALYDSVLDTAAWPAALAGLAEVFQASAATVWRCDPRTLQIDEFSVHGHDERAMALLAAHFVTLDPTTPRVMASAANSGLSDEGLMANRVPSQQPCLQEFALPNGIGRLGGGQVSADARGRLYLGLQRRPGSRPFGEAAQRRFKALAPHLARARAMRARVASTGAGPGLAQSALDSLATPLCVLDGQARVTLVNRAAAEAFGASAPLQYRHGRLHAQPPGLRDWLSAALAQACGTRPRGSDTRWAPLGQPDWSLTLLPLPATHGLRAQTDGAVTCQGPKALLVVGLADRHESSRLQRLFGLTAAEADLLAALARGETATAYARRRGVAVTTVRTHSAALLAKMGCDSQLALVALAHRLPAVRN